MDQKPNSTLWSSKSIVQKASISTSYSLVHAFWRIWTHSRTYKRRKNVVADALCCLDLTQKQHDMIMHLGIKICQCVIHMWTIWINYVFLPPLCQILTTLCQISIIMSNFTNLCQNGSDPYATQSLSLCQNYFQKPKRLN